VRWIEPASVGAGCIVTVQEAILAHWFHGRGLAIAVGLQISMSRLVRPSAAER